jgi:hypothetical protein
MTDLAELHRAVQDTLAGKRLGRPVFVRYLLQSPEKAAVVPRLARLAAVVRQWLGQTLDRVYAVGSAEGGQVSLTLQFREGGSALVSLALGPGPGGVDVLLLGNHGALYHDAGHAACGADPPALPATRPDPALAAAIEKTLRSGKPEPVGPEARP